MIWPLLVTQNGIYHIVFDLMSLMENFVLAIFGYFHILDKAKIVGLICGIILGMQLAGILLKCLYYLYFHPWMNLSKAYKTLQNSVNILFGITIFIALIAMPICGYYVRTMSSTASNTLYIISGLCISFVSNNSRFWARSCTHHY